jgi:hypothetical protein
MPGLNRGRFRRAAGIVCVLAVLSFAAASCKSNSDADDGLAANIVVVNTCGKTVDVFMDGTLQFKVDTGLTSTISTVPAGSHLIAAKVTETETVVHSETLEVVLGYDYAFNVYGPSSITVTNSTGEILKITMDENYVGDIGADLTQTIRRVKFGEHKLKAAKRSDGTEVAAATIDVSEIKDYVWTITK